MANRLVVFGLSLSSSWGNGHATPYRGLLKALAARGWQITFFERDVEWYRSNRDLPDPDYCDLRFYADWSSLRPDAEAAVRAADLVLLGSYVADGQPIADWLGAQGRPCFFYDIDTPITLTGLHQHGATEYLRADQVPLFDVYFSFTGGPALSELQQVWGARHAEALYCGVDPDVHRPVPVEPRFECLLSYMGTYAADRQPKVETLLLEPARRLPERRFVVAMPQAPDEVLGTFPPNVEHFVHLYPRDHPALYCSSAATLNVTRDAMVHYGWSPSVRLFEAAACGACIISDTWPGIEDVLAPGREILLASNTAEMVAHLQSLTPPRRGQIGDAARDRVLRAHSYAVRATQFEQAFALVAGRPVAAVAP